jgi:UDP-N-acetylmuramate dehydrogenase
MIIYPNFFLKNYNTFRLNIKTNFFIKIYKKKELYFFKKNFLFLPKLILGKGSNILFLKNFQGIIINLHLKGKKYFFLKKKYL